MNCRKFVIRAITTAGSDTASAIPEMPGLSYAFHHDRLLDRHHGASLLAARIAENRVMLQYYAQKPDDCRLITGGRGR
jgi:hypothetical protein